MPINPLHQGHRQRLRERFSKDPALLFDYEILELLLGYVLLRKDTKPLAKELLLKFKSIKSVFDAPHPELREINDFGSSLEFFWLLLRELKTRYAESSLRQKEVLCTPENVIDMAKQRLVGKQDEELWGAYVDNQNKLLSWRKIFTGTRGKIVINNSEILRIGLEIKATGFILVHNHPSGNPSPTPEDIDFTLSLLAASKLLNIRFLDHLIITEEKYLSLLNLGIL